MRIWDRRSLDWWIIIVLYFVVLYVAYRWGHHLGENQHGRYPGSD